jgi:hypothetical protein
MEKVLFIIHWKWGKGKRLNLAILPNQENGQFPEEYSHNGITSIHLLKPQEEKKLPRDPVA